MRLLEYQGRLLLKEAGITVPEGAVTESPEEAFRITSEQLNGKAVVKAQVPVGGRGKAGGIKIVDSPEEAREVSKSLLGSELKGEEISRLLLVEPVNIDREFYTSVLLDRGTKGPIVIFSVEGGVDIEEVAAETPEKIHKVRPDPIMGLQPYMIRELLYEAEIEDEVFKGFYGLVEKLFRAYQEYGATLVEINPVGLTKGGELLALDSKVKIDDDSRAMEEVKRVLPEGEERRDKTELERKAADAGLQYVELDGTIGVIGNGAGLVMATLDVLDQKGGQPANFLDVGGGADADLMAKAYEIVTEKEGLNGLFINIFGGITRCDEIAKGIVKALEEKEAELPLVVRLTGTNEKQGRKILEENGIHAAESLDEGADNIIEKSSN
ncbi:MAG: ADP-forming succinate--CoA ligase subunit beta [Candidatus Bipolaricaulota bacterium]|nr:ADP-forming succinate--CoA ligase subunit beta [Candidatus Bipolaricaulota bacterium]MBS3791015.1 ADP-forming succinate--CoA ligase subunit beta [Candidatus Bipolaricaulota bacterium]